MRDYQTKANQGALPDSNSANKYGASEVNSLRSENKNAVSRAGLTLAPQDGTGEDTTQLAQSMLINAVAAQAVQDNGAADAIVLTPISGASGLTLPPDYTTLDGAEFSFFAAFANATTTPTASIGQTAGTQFGTKTITREDGTALSAGDIDPSVMTTLRRDDATDTWLLIRGAGVGNTSAGLILQQKIVTDVTNRSTTSASYVSSSVTATLDNDLRDTNSKVRGRVYGVVGFSTTMIGEFTINDGSSDLHPAGVNGLTAAACPNNGQLTQTRQVSLEFEDSPSSVTPKTYDLHWRTSAGTLYLGRYGNGTTIDMPTIFVLEEIAG